MEEIWMATPTAEKRGMCTTNLNCFYMWMANSGSGHRHLSYTIEYIHVLSYFVCSVSCPPLCQATPPD